MVPTRAVSAPQAHPELRGPMRSHALEELDAVTLPEIATVRHEPMQPGVWEELARRELVVHSRPT